MRAIFVVIAAVFHVVRADDALLHGSGRGWNVTSSRPRTLERGCLLGTESMGYALVLEPGDSASVELFAEELTVWGAGGPANIALSEGAEPATVNVAATGGEGCDDVARWYDLNPAVSRVLHIEAVGMINITRVFVKNGRFFGNEGVEDWLGPGTTTTNGLVETDLPPAPSNPADGAGDFHIEAITIVIAAAVATAALLGWML